MTMTNAEWCIKNGYKFRDIDASRKDDSNWEFEFRILSSDHLYRKIGYLKTYNSMYPSEAVLEWLDMERNVLNDAERRYLAGVISPFRNEIKSVEKSRDWPKSLDRIYFYMKNYEDVWYLPAFKVETMYKGMEVDKEYTVEELGL